MENIFFSAISPVTGCSVSAHVHRHLLIRDDLEDQVVQQCELLSYFQSGVVLKRLCLIVQHSLIHKTHMLFRNCSTGHF